MTTFSLLKLIRYGAILLIGLLGGMIAYQYYLQNQTSGEGELISRVKMGGMFELIDVKSKKKVTQEAFLGKPQALYFGFTHCPDICPTTLFDMNDWINVLGDMAENIHFSFITVDPERDNAELIEGYLSHFSPLIHGYTGEVDEIQKMISSYRIYAKKIYDEDGSGEYTMDHTASILLLDSQSRFIGTIAYGEDDNVAFEKLNRLAEK